MKKSPVVSFLLLLLVVIALIFLYRYFSANDRNNRATSLNEEIAKEQIVEQINKTPLHFQKNEGQVDAEVEYFVRLSNQTIFFTPDEVVYSQGNSGDEDVSGGVIRQRFLEAITPIEVVGEEEKEAKVNYFIGNDPDEWQSDIATYGQVLLKEVYEGIDIRFSGTNQALNHEFQLKPGANIDSVEIELAGINLLELLPDGDLGIQTDWGNFRFAKPVGSQQINGEEQLVSTEFVVIGTNSFGFIIGDYILEEDLKIVF